ncbi:MAG: sigma-70 family RNA polymerase sigma factor [Chloroflexi bacterium]|nr:sigma-70 family RNA polymerase sigma factor [Chloroflexota bacterium]
MRFESVSDEALLKAFQRKDLDALAAFYDRHARAALAVAYRVLGDRGAAEDVVQEAFIALWRSAESFDPDRGAVRSWFLSIVRHRAIDVTRGRAFGKERISLDDAQIEPRYPDAWQQTAASLEKERILKAMDELPQEQREAVTLAYFDGYTQQEIAERAGVPIGTIKGRMRLAMKKLRGILTESDTGE